MLCVRMYPHSHRNQIQLFREESEAKIERMRKVRNPIVSHLIVKDGGVDADGWGGEMEGAYDT